MTDQLDHLLTPAARQDIRSKGCGWLLDEIDRVRASEETQRQRAELAEEEARHLREREPALLELVDCRRDSEAALLEALRIAKDTLIKLAPYSPDVSEGVVAVVGVASDAISTATGHIEGQDRP